VQSRLEEWARACRGTEAAAAWVSRLEDVRSPLTWRGFFGAVQIGQVSAQLSGQPGYWCQSSGPELDSEGIGAE
jgi:hypothetical protein